MAGESPAAVIVDGVNGVEVAVVDAAALPALTRALLVAGIDGSSVAHFLRTDGSGNLGIALASPSSSSVATVAQSATTVTILAANSARKGATVYNDTNRRLYLKLGAGGSSSDFSVELPARGFYELPFPAFVGTLTGAWDAAGGGVARVTELT